MLFTIVISIAFSYLNPQRIYNSARDSQIKQDVATIKSALDSYNARNGGQSPTTNGNPLPTVTIQNLKTSGIAIELVDDLYPTYLVINPENLPTDYYYVGKLDENRYLVGADLTNGSLYTVPEILTPTPTTTPTPFTTLGLTSMCSTNPPVIRTWRVRNQNPFPVNYTWTLIGTSQTGSGIAPANTDQFFDTSTEGTNTLVIYVNSVIQSTKASGGALCPP